MKIAFVSDAVYPYNKGGKEKRLYDLSTRLAKLGYDVHIYCMKWWKGNEAHRLEDGVHLHAISPLYPLYTGERRSIRQALLFGLSCLKLIKENWDVIDVDHMPFYPVIFTKIVCLLKRKRMIATWNEVWGSTYWVEYIGRLGHIAYLVEKLSVGLPDQISSISYHTTERLETMLSRNKGVTTIISGISVSEIKSVSPSEKKTDLIFAGRLLKHKNVDLILKALHILKAQRKKLTCTIIGKGPEEKRLKRLAERLEVADQITFEDFLPSHDDVLSRFKSATLFVFPSQREGFGLVAVEANACGIPVVTLDHLDNNARTLISEQSGRLCKKNPESLAAAITELLQEDPVERKKHCIQNARKYYWDRRIKEFVEFYTS